MDTDTPRTDQILDDAPLRLCGESAREAFEMMYRHAQELEREINEMTTKQIELVNHLKLYRGQVNNEGDHTACDALAPFANAKSEEPSE